MPQPGLGMGFNTMGVLEQNLPPAQGLGLDPQQRSSRAELQALGAAARTGHHPHVQTM